MKINGEEFYGAPEGYRLPELKIKKAKELHLRNISNLEALELENPWAVRNVIGFRKGLDIFGDKPSKPITDADIIKLANSELKENLIARFRRLQELCGVPQMNICTLRRQGINNIARMVLEIEHRKAG